MQWWGWGVAIPVAVGTSQLCPPRGVYSYLCYPGPLGFMCRPGAGTPLLPPSFAASAKMVAWACLVLLLLPLLAAATSGSSLASSARRRQAYIVHMDAAEVAALDLALAGEKHWYDAAIDSLVDLSSQETEGEKDDDGAERRRAPRLLYVYETVISGFAAELSPKHARLLPRLHGFLSASPDETLLSLHTTYSPHFLGLVPGKGLWGANSTSASDVIIGVIDTGIWPEHASFKDVGFNGVPARWKGACEASRGFPRIRCNKKLVGARAFYRGYEASTGKINETREYRSARDSNGHGTHTASTAAGNVVADANLFGNARGSASGMSYASRVAVYKACWSAGCANSDILAAIDRAVADGVHVLSLSLGGPSRPFYEDTLAIAAFGAVQKGVFVSCSAGNSGPSESTVSNIAPWITTVAASYLDRSFPTTVTLGDGRLFRGASLYVGRPTKRAQLVYGKKAGPDDNAAFCLPGTLSPRLVRGKIVMCDRGISRRLSKGEQVKLAGGAGMLLLNTDDQGEELFADPHVLPASSMGAAAAKSIRSYATSSPQPTAVISFQGTAYGFLAPAMAAFSSRGPSADGPDVIKPDITAPGVSILAAWPHPLGPSLLQRDQRRPYFNIISGTSMSCPHVSGVAALLKSRHPDWSPAALKSALMTTAYILDNRERPISDVSTGSPANPFALGSGHVDPERAADPGLVYDITAEDYLKYLCSLNYTPSQVNTVTRRRIRCPQNRRALQAGDLNYPSFAVLFRSGGAANATATFTRTVTNVGPAGCTYTVNVREPKGVSVTVEPRVLGFVRKGEKLSYSVTFVGRGGSGSSFGEVVWVCGRYSVRSPIAATWGG